MERNKKDIILILDRHNNDLWINTDNGHRAVIRNVTGVVLPKRPFKLKKGVTDYYIPMWSIMSYGKRIGEAWDVKEIKEEW
ncbi:unnamed protein product [marine sediment metagenome]|uniref:Uncharacterized protein n=1 Tax=marine sediment metagenome TaxID=412755 RepID=X1F6X8_9ZZZZ